MFTELIVSAVFNGLLDLNQDRERNKVDYIYIMHLADAFLQSDLQKSNKSNPPTIFVIYNAWFIRQLD